MKRAKHLFSSYTAEVMNYTLGDAAAEVLPPPADLSESGAERHLLRLERLLGESGRENVILFGSGSHCLVRHAASLCERLQRSLVICELNLQRGRELYSNPAWHRFAGSACLICDSSPRAILTLLLSAGASLENSVFYLCPGLPEAETKALQACMQLVQRSRPIRVAKEGDSQAWAAGQISILAILHPDEPGLHEFCTQIPDGIKELVIVWDSPTPLKQKLTAACPIIQANRDLSGDFAAQRNFALGLCSAPWVLALDGDERLDPQGWAEVKAACVQNEADAYYLPRLTLFPDDAHFRTGFGLWPDFQLRLFRRTDKTLFARPVHEVLIGIAGASAILQQAPLWHLSYVSKDRDALEARLAVFNTALGKQAHRLSRDYPHLPLAWYHELAALCPDLKSIVLPK